MAKAKSKSRAKPKAKAKTDPKKITRRLTSEGDLNNLLRRCKSMSTQQATLSGKLGEMIASAVEACVIGLSVPLDIIEPTAWKKYHGLIGKDKNDSRQRALFLFPSARESLARVMDHNRAEAVLMAAYGAALHRGQTAKQ